MLRKSMILLLILLVPGIAASQTAAGKVDAGITELEKVELRLFDQKFVKRMRETRNLKLIALH